MNLLKQLLIIFVLCLCGEVISIILPFAFPSSVISLILLFILLILKWIKPEQIAEVSEYLLGIMAFFFIPSGVAIMEKYHLIRSSILPLTAIVLLTTVITFAVSGYTVLFFIKLMKRREEKKHE